MLRRTHLTLLRRPGWSDDRGSLPMALLFVVIATTLMGAMLGSVAQGQRSTRFDRNFTQSLHGADAGINAAYHQLQSGYLQTQPLSGTPQQTATYTTTQADGTQVSWYAQRAAGLSWRVVSTGTFQGVDRQVTATITERPRHYNGVFGDSLAGLNGTSTVIDSYDSGTCTSPAAVCQWGTDATCGTCTAAVGTNNTFNWSGNGFVSHIVLHDWAANPATGVTGANPGGNRCNGLVCTSSSVESRDPRLDYSSDTAMKPIFDKLTSCSGRATYNQDVVFTNTTIAPYNSGAQPNANPLNALNTNFHCYRSITFKGDVTLSGASPATPVVIFVRDYVKFDKVGCCGPVVNCVGCSDANPRGVRPVPSNLQIFVASQVVSGGGDINAQNRTLFAGVIHAPRARCLGDTNVHIYGSIVCAVVDNVGNWQFHYDDQLSLLGSAAFDVTHWAEA